MSQRKRSSKRRARHQREHYGGDVGLPTARARRLMCPDPRCDVVGHHYHEEDMLDERGDDHDDQV